MSGKGIVMEVAPKHYIVLTPSGEFRKVPRTGQPDADIGDEIALLSRRRASRRTIWTLTSTALVMLILFPLVLVPNTKADPIVAYVTLDVNPSVEMGIGGREQVKELRGLNAEGEQVVSGLEYKGAKAADVAAEIVARASANTAYSLGEDQDIVIASVVLEGETEDPERFEAELEAEIRGAVRKQLADEEHVTMLSAPQEVREEASRQGVSTGKMAVYLLTKSKNPDVQLDTLKTQSIHEWTEPVGGLKSVVPAKPAKAAKPAKSTASDAPADPVKPKETAPNVKDKDGHTKRIKHAEERHKREKERLKELLDREKNGGSASSGRNDDKQQSGWAKGTKEENKGGSASSGSQNAGKPGGSKGAPNQETGSKLTGGSSGPPASSDRGESGSNGSKGSGWDNWSTWKGWSDKWNGAGSGKAGDNKAAGSKNGTGANNQKNGNNAKSSGKSNNGQSGSDKKTDNGKAGNSQSNNGKGGKSSGSASGGNGWNGNRGKGSNNNAEDRRGGSSGDGGRGSVQQNGGSGKNRDDDDKNRDRKDDKATNEKGKNSGKGKERG